jgi:glycosyltransferase involved in cell wall biosynthesis
MIYDARELYTGLPAVASRPFVRYVWRKWESAGMMEADFISITAPHDADAIFRVHSFLPRPILIRNIPLRSGETRLDVQFLRDRGIKESDKVAVYVGGLQADRGLEECVASLSQLPAHVKLLLIGSGTLETKLKEAAAPYKDWVVFAGAVEQERVMPILAACDVGLSLIQANSPSYELALPSKIFEYLHAGLPVVSTELRHVTELFDHQPYMQYVKTLSAEEIGDAITRGIKSKAQFGEAILDAAMQYSFESDFEKLKTLLSERLAERG